VLGGCRSGKSAYALKQADKTEALPKYFIATSVPEDREMHARVAKHRAERGSDWQTIEEPVNLGRTIRENSSKASVILVDCLTLWVSNLLHACRAQDDIEQAIQDLETALEKAGCPVFLVSNEVGWGIVPENSLARRFRDLAGSVNQRIAAVADKVVLTVAGMDVQIKPKP